MKFVVGLSVALFIFSIVGVIALNNFFAVVTTSWDAQTILIWAAIPSVFLLGVIIWMLNRATSGSSN